MKLYFYINNFRDNKGIEMEECEVRETPTRYYPINNFPKGFCNYHAYVNKSDIGIVVSRWGQNAVIIKEPDFELAKRLLIEQMEKEIEAEKDKIEKLKEKIKEKENNLKIIELCLDYDEDVCDECLNCAYYWQNTDTENECEGDKKEPCHEFIEFKGIGH